jgi:hypothetical protein
VRGTLEEELVVVYMSQADATSAIRGQHRQLLKSFVLQAIVD